MLTGLPHDWWRRRWVWLPVLGILMIAGSMVVAWIRSGVSRIMVYNDTGAPLEHLRISACGQSITFDEVVDGESVRLTLEPTGGASEARVSTNGIEFWHGDYVEPREYRLSVHLMRGGEISSSSSISWVRRPFFSSLDAP